MRATEELVKRRKENAAKLTKEMHVKLLMVQKLVIKRLLAGEDIVFEINSYAKAAILYSFKGIQCGDSLYKANLQHYEHMSFYFDNSICEFYEDQLIVINKWIEILK